MELKVWVEGIQRIVCGVTDATTCQDVVYAFAHATGKTGRFTLVEKWRHNERLLPPQERPLKVLSKWGEYASDVQLVLRRSALDAATRSIPELLQALPSPPPGGTTTAKMCSPPPPLTQHQTSHSHEPSSKKPVNVSVATNHTHHEAPQQPSVFRDVPKERRDWSEVPWGVVKGIPQQRDEQPSTKLVVPNVKDKTESGGDNAHRTTGGGGRVVLNMLADTPPPPPQSSPSGPGVFRAAPAQYASFESPVPNVHSPSRSQFPSQESVTTTTSSPSQGGHENYSSSHGGSVTTAGDGGMYNGGLSGGGGRTYGVAHLGTPKSRRNLLSEFKRHDLEEELREGFYFGPGQETKVVYDKRYHDMIQLVNFQREKLSLQEAHLTKYNAEISYWEAKHKDHKQRLKALERDIQNAEFTGRAIEEEISQLDKLHLDGELDIGWQQEKMLQSELTLLRSKLANCETELLQCKNKIRLVMDDILEAKRRMTKEAEAQQANEDTILNSLDNLHRDIQDAVQNYESKLDTWKKLNEDVQNVEQAIVAKKKQADGLVQELKEANLESLIFVPSEEISQFVEGGVHKGLGSSRRMVGSPRQLENAVPTSKNPHGVWV